jgi:hypothetical protein
MKLKIAVGKLNYADQFTPIKQEEYSPKSPIEALSSFKKFFTDNPEISVPQNVELILQSGDPITVSTILSIKYFLYEKNIGLEYYAYDDSDETILDDITRSTGILLLDEAQNFYGFIPRGYFKRLASEDDANPVKIYSWIGDTVKLFPSSSSDPYTNQLYQVKEFEDIMGTVSSGTMANLMKILSAFKKRIVVI